MGRHDPRVDAYIAGAAEFAQPILKHLRRLVHSACPEVEETIKWGFPHFVYAGNLCHMAAFQRHCAFGFWKSRLLFGPSRGGVRAAEAMGNFGRLTAVSDLPSAVVLRGYVRKAARLNQAGVKSPVRPRPRRRAALKMPPMLRQALLQHPNAKATFEKFSYSHQKEYVEWLTEAKREETRARRLATTLEWLALGRPRHWKYAPA